MTNLVNTYESVVYPTVKSTINILEWLEQIKHSEFSDTIVLARQSNKIVKDNIKKAMPCVTYNFLYNQYKKDSNLIDSTGLVYIDIDDSNFNPSSLDLTKVFSYYKSFGGNGYAMIIQVKGVTKSNFKPSYQSICNQLGITQYVDSNAVKHSQYNVLSYDENIYINTNSYVFDFDSNLEIEKKTQPIGNYQNGENIYGGVGSFSENIRFNNLNEFDFQNHHSISNWTTRFDFIECSLPFNKIEDKRKRTLLAYLNNFVWLNPNLQYYHYFNLMMSVNNKISVVPVSSNIIEGMLRSVLKQKNEGTLKPKYKVRRILFAPTCELSTDDKRAVIGNSIKDKWYKEATYKINDTIECWNFSMNGKITAKSVSEISKLNLKTVKKYWAEFKQFVAELNRENNQIKTIKKLEKIENQPIEKKDYGLQLQSFKDQNNNVMKVNSESKNELLGLMNTQVELLGQADKKETLNSFKLPEIEGVVIGNKDALLGYYNSVSDRSKQRIVDGLNYIKHSKYSREAIKDFYNNKVLRFDILGRLDGQVVLTFKSVS